MFQEIDCRGLSCPQPVINTKKVLDNISSGTVVTIVDNEVAKENLLKFAKGLNLTAEVSSLHNEEYQVTIHKGPEVSLGFAKGIETTKGSYVLLMTSNVLGKGNDDLGGVLIKSFFYTLTEQENKPLAIAFLNAGVFLTCENSLVLEHLMHIEVGGTEILSCGTCLDFYNLKDKLCVGSISNMYTIMEKILKADKVITL